MKLTVYSRLRKQYLECELALEISAHSYCGDTLEDALRAFQEQLKQEEAHL